MPLVLDLYCLEQLVYRLPIIYISAVYYWSLLIRWLLYGTGCIMVWVQLRCYQIVNWVHVYMCTILLTALYRRSWWVNKVLKRCYFSMHHCAVDKDESWVFPSLEVHWLSCMLWLLTAGLITMVIDRGGRHPCLLLRWLVGFPPPRACNHGDLSRGHATT